MHYTSKQLCSSDVCLHMQAFLFYFDMYQNNKKAFHKLCCYEKDFFFSFLETFKGEGVSIDIYNDQEAYEYLFSNIIIAYKEQIVDFGNAELSELLPVKHRDLSKDVPFFLYYYRIWLNIIDHNQGKFVHIISKCIKKRLEEIKGKGLASSEYAIREKICYSMFFYIYYKLREYFEQVGKDYIVFNSKNDFFRATALTFCHILSRHYIPSLNFDSGATLNYDDLFEDSKDLLEDIKCLVLSYFEHVDNIVLNNKVGHLLFEKNNEKYIMWLVKKKISTLPYNEGFEIKTFYRCSCEKNLALFNGTKVIPLINGWYGCMENSESRGTCEQSKNNK